MLVQGIAGDINALGFFGLAYYLENQSKLKAVAIKVKDDSKAVLPSVDAARDGSYQPLSRPIFIYVSKKSVETRPAVVKFVEFYLDKSHASKLVKEVGYVCVRASKLSCIADAIASVYHSKPILVRPPAALQPLASLPNQFA